MPTFAYTARDESGTAVTGMMEADSIAHVGQMLRAEGKYPTAVNPVNGKSIPIWIADYVLADYGTGAINYEVADVPRGRLLSAPWGYNHTQQSSTTLTITHR